MDDRQAGQLVAKLSDFMTAAAAVATELGRAGYEVSARLSEINIRSLEDRSDMFAYTPSVEVKRVVTPSEE